MANYKIEIDEEALHDIQKATDWYNDQLKDLGGRFQRRVKLQISSLRKAAALYPNRYADVHCMFVKKFPFLVHYKLDKKLLVVEVFAVLHTSRNPKIWEGRIK